VHTRSGAGKFIVEALGVPRSVGLSVEQTRDLFRDYGGACYMNAIVAISEWIERESMMLRMGRSTCDLSEFEEEKRRSAFRQYAECMNNVELLSGKLLNLC
jgi:hypothetical protein